MAALSNCPPPPVITICPQCQLPLAVTAADLRIAQGQVRCGRCAAVFNALASLYEPGNVAIERRGAASAEETAATGEVGVDDLGGSATPDAAAAVDDDGSPGPAQAASLAPAAASAPDPTMGTVATPDEAREPITNSFDRESGDTRPRREPDWQIDTMTAAELAALVARADRDEPDELAAIQIAMDDAWEITVLPSESPRVLPPADPQSVDTTVPSSADDLHAGTLPRLDAVPADDPGFARARAAASQVLALSRNEPSLRWLELEPAQPAPGSLAASLGLAAEGDFGARTGVGLEERSTRGATLPGRDDRAGAYPHRDDPAGDDPAGDDPADDAALEIAHGGADTRHAVAPRWMLAATVVLGVALAVQLAHLYREDLVGIPALQGPLTTLYAALGRPVAPRWDIRRYDVRQQGVVAEPVAAGTLTVRASIRNGAVRAQPAPLLRVTLQDRFGNRIATRDLTPREYGGAGAMAPAPMLAPGQRIDAEVSLLDPGGEAVGFELDVCLRRPDASISCANDAPAANG